MCRDIQLRIRKSVGTTGNICNGRCDRRSQGCGIGKAGAIQDENLDISVFTLSHDQRKPYLKKSNEVGTGEFAKHEAFCKALQVRHQLHMLSLSTSETAPSTAAHLDQAFRSPCPRTKAPAPRKLPSGPLILPWESRL